MWVDAQESAFKDAEPVHDPRNWYVAQLRASGLVRARENLGRQGFATFMAMRNATSRRHGRLVSVDKPIFPGYLFVQVAPDRSDWRCINATYGVASLVCLAAHAPTRMPVSLMSGLFACCKGEAWHPTLANLSPGAQICLVAGPFAEAIATVDSLPENDRIFVLLDLMGRSVRMSVESTDVERR